MTKNIVRVMTAVRPYDDRSNQNKQQEPTSYHKGGLGPSPTNLLLISNRQKSYDVSMNYAIKADVTDPGAEIFTFTDHKTMYGGKHIAVGDTIFIFASENEGGQGLIARGIVTFAQATMRKPDIDRQTPRVSITIQRTETTNQRLGRDELKPFSNWNDGQPQSELNFKFYRQATNKIVGISEQTAAFLMGFF